MNCVIALKAYGNMNGVGVESECEVSENASFADSHFREKKIVYSDVG